MTVFALLALTASAGIAVEGIEVHEWGVLLWDGQEVTSSGIPVTVLEDFGLMEAKAPVVLFHGAEFTGTVTVASPGTIEDVYPAPDCAMGPGSGLCPPGSMIGWEISATAEEPAGYPSCGSGSDPLPPGYAWAAPLWREGDALCLTRDDGFRDRFLYYETSIGLGAFPPPLVGFAVASAEEDAPEADRVLLFTRDGSGSVNFVILPQGDVSMADQASPFVYSREEVVAILEGWAGGALTPPEVNALWVTWEGCVVDEAWSTGSRAVFVVPDDLLRRTSIILVDPEEDLPVEIRRFFLGIVDV